MGLLTLAQQVVNSSQSDSSPLYGVAAIIGAVGVIVVGWMQVRSQRAINQGAKERDKIETKADSATAQALDAKQHAALAGAAASVLAQQAEERLVGSDVVAGFTRTIDTFTQQLIDMSTATNAQLERSTAALVACEEREAQAAVAMGQMRSEIESQSHEIAGLRSDVNALERIVARFGGDGLTRTEDEPA